LKIQEKQKAESKEKEEMKRIYACFASLTKELKQYRLLLSDSERREFDQLWGLDGNGNYKLQNDGQSSDSSSFFRQVFSKVKGIFASKNAKQKETIGDLILSELEATERTFREEKDRFIKEDPSEKEKGKRFMYLFQKDLMPGINGMILESKEKRDEVHIKGVSRTAKIVAWLFLGISHVCMLFYILLFALSQDSHRQAAWGQSFVLWMITEILVVSSLSVFIMNVVVPSLVMKDVNHIKKKLVTTVLTFYTEMAKEKLNHQSEPKLLTENDNNEEKKGEGGEAEENNKLFNSAEYFFVSTRLARDYSDLKLAKLVLSFHTPWPKQSYQHVTDVSKKYNRKFSTITRSLSIVILFFLSSLISVPISVQDMIIHMTSTVALGYTILFHVQLYAIFPVLILIPTIFLAIIIHFVLQSNKAKRQIEQVKLMKDIQAVEDENKKNAQMIADVRLNNIDIKVRGQEDEKKSEFSHQRRRASIQAGISLVKQFRRDMKAQREEKDGLDEDDDEDDDGSFLFPNDGSEEDPISSLGSSDSSAAAHDKRFHHLARTFDAHVKESSSSDDEEDTDEDEEFELLNLHLAVDKAHQRPQIVANLPTNKRAPPVATMLLDDDELDLDDDVDDQEDEGDMKVVSLSNSSIASRLLSLPDPRRRSYQPTTNNNSNKHHAALAALNEAEEKDEGLPIFSGGATSLAGENSPKGRKDEASSSSSAASSLTVSMIEVTSSIGSSSLIHHGARYPPANQNKFQPQQGQSLVEDVDENRRDSAVSSDISSFHLPSVANPNPTANPSQPMRTRLPPAPAALQNISFQEQENDDDDDDISLSLDDNTL
jgi:uncharacterized membrane protein